MIVGPIPVCFDSRECDMDDMSSATQGVVFRLPIFADVSTKTILQHSRMRLRHRFLAHSPSPRLS